MKTTILPYLVLFLLSLPDVNNFVKISWRRKNEMVAQDVMGTMAMGII